MGGKGDRGARTDEAAFVSAACFEQRSSRQMRYLWVNSKPLLWPYTKSDLSASTTMKTTRANAASGFSVVHGEPSWVSSKVARPGRRGLYGKKPMAKTNSARGSRMLLTARAPNLSVLLRAMALLRTHGTVTERTKQLSADQRRIE